MTDLNIDNVTEILKEHKEYFEKGETKDKAIKLIDSMSIYF